MSIIISYPTITLNTFLFPAGEVHVQLKDLPKQKPERIDLYASLQNSDDLMTLLLVHNALTSHYTSPLKINLEIPYFPYARQDRVCAKGQAFSLAVMAKLINDLSLHSLQVWDAHSPVTEALTGAINIPQQTIIAQSPKLTQYLQQDNAVLVCPDKGARNKCMAIKQRFSVKALIHAEKIRNPKTGKITKTRLKAEDLTGKIAIITDDICDGGRTFIEIAKKLKEKQASKIILYVTHGIFSKGLDVFDGLIDEIYTSNSLPQQHPSLNIINFYSEALGSGSTL